MRHLIRRLLFLLLGCFAASSHASATPVEEGERAFASGDYAAAIRSYETALAVGPKSPGLYYNLGMAQFKDGQLPRAAINFRRALILDARFVDARIALSNLERSQGLPVTPPDWRMRLAERASLKFLIVAGCGLGWLGAFLLLFAIFKSGGKFRTGSLAIFLLVIGGGTFTAAYLADPRVSERNSAIVADKEGATLLAAPANQSAAVTRLPMCAPLQILKRSGEWTFCVTPAGNKGWVESFKIEAIMPQGE